MSSDQDDPRDPWLWTNQDLIEGLSHSTWLAHRLGKSAMSDTDLERVLHQLRKQKITGATLLILDAEGLHREIGIENSSQCLDLMRVIGILRFNSDGYKAYTAISGVDELRLHDAALSVSTQSYHPKRDKIAPNHVVPHDGEHHLNLTTSSLMTVDQAREAMSGVGEWDHLLHWEQAEESYTPDDDGNATEAEVEDLNEGDEEEEQEEEETLIGVNLMENNDADMTAMAKEMHPTKEQTRRAKLTSEEIIGIINERIEHYTNSWYLNKGTEEDDMVEDNPNKIWDEAYATGRRLSLIKKYNMEVTQFTQRLDVFCEEIMTYPGNNPEKVRHQCQNLETTINNLQLAEYFLSVYSLEPVFDTEDNLVADGDETLSEIQSPTTNNFHTTTRVPPRITDLEVESGIADTGVDGHAAGNMSSIRPIAAKHFTTPSREHSPDSVLGDTMELAESIEPVPVKTTSKKNEQLTDVTLSLPPQLGDEPENAPIASVRHWNWRDLIDNQDRKRIVSKAIYEMSTIAREAIRERLKDVGKPSLMREVLACMIMLAKGEKRMQGSLARDLEQTIGFMRLFLCWWFCDDYTKPEREPSKQGLEEAVKCIQDGSRDLAVLCSYSYRIMGTTFSPQALQEPGRPSQAEIVEISSDDDELPPQMLRTTVTQKRSRT